VAQKPDTVTAKNSGGDFQAHSEGQFPAVCVDVVDLGEKVDEYQGKTKVLPKVALVFATGEHHKEGDKGLVLITMEMTNSAADVGKLRPFLESWRGKSYSPEQVAAGLPLHKLHGATGLITVEHVITKSAKTFAKIRSISQLPAVMTAPAGVLDEYARPKFFGDRKAKYADELAKHRATKSTQPEPENPPADDDEDSDLPF
jgi:hypothetical protein